MKNSNPSVRPLIKSSTPPLTSPPKKSVFKSFFKLVLNRKDRPKQYRRQLLSATGQATMLQTGYRYSPWRDSYHLLLTMKWWQFLGLIFGLYVVTNLLFAVAYLLGGEAIANAQPGSLLDAFFFSVQTMATIGYGAMYPKTVYANVLVSIEAIIGLLGVAMATGLMFARFSRPTARVLFSRVAVIVPYDGKPMLMFRAANKRGNQIVEARLWVSLLRRETTIEGHTMRRFYDMGLLRSHSPFFQLTWTAMHPIDEISPLFGHTHEALLDSDTTILVSLTGIDETVGQPVHARHAYSVQDLLWNHRFVDMAYDLPDGNRVLDYTYFHEVVAIGD